jgi:hypothetical protein
MNFEKTLVVVTEFETNKFIKLLMHEVATGGAAPFVMLSHILIYMEN